MNRLNEKVAIVTGAAQGIGATYALALAAEGAKVVLCDLHAPDETASAIRAKGGTALAVACDVTDGAAVQAMVSAALEAFAGIHILVNNAALFATLQLKPFEQTESAEWDRIMTVNVRGSFECAKAVLPVMRQQGYGKIVNIASATAFKGAPMMLAYVASKGAIIAMTRSIAREVGDAGIRCNCLAPGLTMSANVQANADWAEAIVKANIASRCIKREAVPEDLIGALLFLSSADSDFMSGQTIVVDGGSVTH
ncbi:MAG: SDR family oxidoreductase [Pseudomonas sp.]|jgi:NAD(P)-dependent dehydrogenase (short-subunit alcohol dehydrogenase family)|uniref:SDR family NAD(P)-dependent oxidoreductase n=1 Tax=Pseudomonas sp. CFII64 TaxID=911242 RepID=UPI00035800ED|nr:glucose 1-dehydrogenase [Pseudomonas sp. CFII64]EPJ76771.1 short-chain dehydrogenase/reductase SDR [Pseudomonas sp. CFII64]